MEGKNANIGKLRAAEYDRKQVTEYDTKQDLVTLLYLIINARVSF
jgi:hypothetical protein